MRHRNRSDSLRTKLSPCDLNASPASDSRGDFGGWLVVVRSFDAVDSRRAINLRRSSLYAHRNFANEQTAAQTK